MHVDYTILLTKKYNDIKTANTKPVQDFIADYQLQRNDGVTCFTATIRFNNKGLLHTIVSEVQIVRVLDMMVLYIFEFFNEEYGFREMYGTQDHCFRYSKGSALEISNEAMRHRLHIAVMPLP